MAYGPDGYLYAGGEAGQGYSHFAGRRVAAERLMVTVREERLPAGWQAVRLENQDLSVLLLPEKGSDIYELRSRPHDLDVLWKAPWGLRPPSVSTGTAMQSATVWLDHYAGGWQELFPNAGDACRYRGAELGFHGEASVAPWRYEIMTGEDGGPEVRLELRCARMPFRLEKRVSLDPGAPGAAALGARHQ